MSITLLFFPAPHFLHGQLSYVFLTGEVAFGAEKLVDRRAGVGINFGRSAETKPNAPRPLTVNLRGLPRAGLR
jgi:hypothetical protein